MNNIHIHNRTNLPLKVIVDILDQWQESSYGETSYVGKCWRLGFETPHERFQMEIMLRKTCLVVVVNSKGKLAV